MVNGYSNDRKRFSILINHPKNSTSTLLVKGIDESMRNFIEFGDSYEPVYQNTIEENNKRGLKTYIFAKRVFSEEQTKFLMERYASCKRNLVDQEIGLQQLAEDMETSLKVVAIIGFKNQMKEDSKPLVSS